MSRDASRTYIHLHQPRFADLFEDFTITSQSSSQSAVSTNGTSINTATTLNANPQKPHHHGHQNIIPPEDIMVPPHLMPPDPEDEDDVVPDQHAAFGISQAMAAREGRKKKGAWRDFDRLADVVRGLDLEEPSSSGAAQGTTNNGAGGQSGRQRGGVGSTRIGSVR